MNVERILWSSLYRVLEAVFEAGPTVFAGFLIAAIFRRILGPEDVRRLFGADRWSALPRAWALGMLLPVCSLGAIPIVRELRRSGLKGGAILAFALSAPLFNPLSFLYGLTLSEPAVIFAFALTSFVIVTVVGAVWERYWGGDVEVPVVTPAVPPGFRRMLAVVESAARDAAGPSMGYGAIALVGVGLLAAIIPYGSLQTTMQHDDPWAPLQMAAVSLPAYDTPIKAMMQLGLMFEHGNSVGAALTLLILGAGAQLGLVAWCGRTFGLKRTAAWLALVLGVVLSLAYAFEKPLFFAEHVESHTHAFDDFASPFTSDAPLTIAGVAAKLRGSLERHEIVGAIGVAVLAIVGALLRIADRQGAVEAWFCRSSLEEEGVRPAFDIVLPSRVLATVCIAALVLFSLIACFIYYPDPKTVFAEMRMVRAVVLSGVLIEREREQTLRGIRRWDDLSRKLEVGSYLRRIQLDDQARKAADEFRETLEELRDALLEHQDDRLRELWRKVIDDYDRLRDACAAVVDLTSD